MPISSDWRPSPSAEALRDQLSIHTPELVEIKFPLAGVGSRFLAVLLDYLLQFFAALLLSLLFLLLLTGAALSNASPSGATSSKWITAALIAIPFLLQWGYFSLFEAFWRGQTPGKRLLHIRVIQQTGRPVSLFESLGRNLIRVVDMLPVFYIVGIISVFVTRRQQRLGDLVAGTLVIHERELEAPLESIGISRTFTNAAFQTTSTPVAFRTTTLPADKLHALTVADLQALESYLSRRLDVPVATRDALAARLASEVSRRMNYEIPAEMPREIFLEEVAYALRSTPNLRR